MPELPEVETYVRELQPILQERQIAGATVRWSRSIATPDEATFVRAIQGQQFATFARRGKYMLFGLRGKQNDQQQTLIIHLRMTGRLTLHTEAVAPDRHTHLLFDLVDGSQLHFQDARKFGRVWLTANEESVLSKLGPEPLSAAFQPTALCEKLGGRKASIKALLLDQAVVAGVGNIYADESLHLAGIHPARAGGSLTAIEATKLHGAIQTVLQQAIAQRGSSLGNSGIQNYQRPSGEQGSFQHAHRVFQRTGEPCGTCGALVERIVLAQRSTHFCPSCQPHMA